MTGLYNYWVVIALMMTGFYAIMAHENLIKKLMGLSIFQASVILLYVSLGKVVGGTAAITPTPPPHGDPAAHHAWEEAVSHVVYSNPIPHVLMLTAIVVGVATTAVGLALAVRIKEAYGTIEDDDIQRMDGELQ